MKSNWSYSPETPNLGQNRRFFVPCDREIWRMTLKNNRAPLLCRIKLCASFQTGVTVRKRLNWVLTSGTLTFDTCTLPSAWTSLLSMAIIPDKFHDDTMTGILSKRCDRRTDRRSDWTNHRAAWSQLKKHDFIKFHNENTKRPFKSISLHCTLIEFYPKDRP